MTSVETIQENYQRVLERIVQVAREAGRNPDEIRLVVVTKGHPLDVTHAALQAGAEHLGENYADEGAEKIQVLSEVETPPVDWHMIGHVQTRKARLVAAYFDYFHALDSFKLARQLDERCRQFERRLPVLLELNVSGEESKFGWQVQDQAALEALYPDLEAIIELPHLEIRGLMTMPPYFDDAEKARPYFQRLRQYRDRLADRFPDACWDELSMGMSADYQVAIQEGTTWVRIGTAILGPRPT